MFCKHALINNKTWCQKWDYNTGTLFSVIIRLFSNVHCNGVVARACRGKLKRYAVTYAGININL